MICHWSFSILLFFLFYIPHSTLLLLFFFLFLLRSFPTRSDQFKIFKEIQGKRGEEKQEGRKKKKSLLMRVEENCKWRHFYIHFPSSFKLIKAKKKKEININWFLIKKKIIIRWKKKKKDFEFEGMIKKKKIFVDFFNLIFCNN